MRQFTELFTALDTTTRTVEKVQALEQYFSTTSPRDAVWALYFLSGRRIKRAVNTRLLREWLSAETGLPLWIIDESYDAVGDLAETLALLLPDRADNTVSAPAAASDVDRGMLFSQQELLGGYLPQNTAPHHGTAGDSPLPLHRLVEERILPLTELPIEAQRLLVMHTWRELDAQERLVWHKLIMGEFRVGVARTLVAKALANVAGVPPEIMSHRLMGQWEPTEADYQRLLKPSATCDPGQPYPFFLAHPLAGDPQQLGDPQAWQAEWKWDGIRAQLLRRQDQVVLWSRGEDLLTDRFPEIAAVGEALPNGVVLDGEILAWRDEQPLPFTALQTRIGRKKLTPAVLADAPAAFMAYDLLELESVDIRASPLIERRAKLEALATRLRAGPTLRVSATIEYSSWDELVEMRRRARQRGVEGVMLKRRASPYGVGRPKGDWWKWKVDPLAIDAVLIYAQPGHGRRASLHTDYTFGVWHAGELVPIAKAYSGLTDEEIRQVDAFVRRNTIERHGPVRIVRPQLVFELHFEAVQVSSRHRSGLAVRFPRMNRWRRDKRPEEADTFETLRSLAASLQIKL